MSTEIKVPVLPESVQDAVVAAWHKKPGDAVKRDENLVDLETDKVVLEVPAPHDGILKSIACEVGATVLREQILGLLEAGTATATVASPVQSVQPAVPVAPHLTPAIRQSAGEIGLTPADLVPTGKGGRVTREDLSKATTNSPSVVAVQSSVSAQATGPVMPVGDRLEKRVPMNRLRIRVAERLLAAQQQNAILTTFNEINLLAVSDLRKKYKDQFEKKHSVRLGFMSFFVKAAVEALKRTPAVNASIEGTDMIYHGYMDIGVAVSSDRGLLVPIIRDAEKKSLADFEREITGFGERARKGQITLDEMTGGTFTISNGGVFGSLLSTPILNPPQSAILGMHKIEDRPVVENGQIVIRPMMYVALSYDHRIIDGKESVTFLRTIKELLEDPARLLLDI